MIRYIAPYTLDNPPPLGDTVWAFHDGEFVILGGHVVPLPDVADMCHQCTLRPVDFDGDICEDCAWDIHDQLDGAD